MAEPPWSQYDQAYKRIHERLAEILAQLSTVKDPSKYLPIRLSDGSAFYNAGGGAGGGLVQNQIRNAGDTDWVNEPFTRQVTVQNSIDVIDKADRLLGKICGSQDVLQQRATTKELLVQISHQGAEIDPRQTRQLTSSDVVTLNNQINRDTDGHGQVDIISLPSIPAGSNTIGKINLNTSPGEASFVFEGDTASPTGAGEITIKTVTPANGETRYVTDIVGGGNIKGHVTIYWGSSVKWRGRFLADASVGEQLKTPIKVVGDGSTGLALKVYASGAGNVEAFWGVTW